MLCDNCFYLPSCIVQPDEDGRCDFYIKNKKIAINKDVEIDTLDTETFDYDIEKLLEEIDLDEELRKTPER